MRFVTALPVAAALLVTACTAVGPEYTSPTTPLPAHYVGGGSSALLEAARDQWWLRLNDPHLNRIVSRGLASNLDIKTALERINEANAAAGRTGLNAQLSGGISATARESDSDNGATVENDNVSFDAQYVFDLFGGVRRGRQQAIANIEAAQADAGTVRLAYLSDLVGSYLRARYFQEAAALTRWTVENRQRTLNVVNRRREEGEATELELQQGRSLLLSASARLPVLLAQFEGEVFHIATLLNEPAGPILSAMRSGSRQPRGPRVSSTGVPADLLRNRPDIRSAERQLASATAGIGVAEAQLYPALSLNGFVTAGSNDSYSFGPTLSLPVLNRGFLNANRKVAQSQARQAELNWRNSVVSAVEDVQVALSQYVRWRQQLSRLNNANSASREVLRLSRNAYNGGAIALDEVLDAERQAFDVRIASAQAAREYTLSWTRLQVATGRGWYPYGAAADDPEVKVVLGN